MLYLCLWNPAKATFPSVSVAVPGYGNGTETRADAKLTGKTLLPAAELGWMAELVPRELWVQVTAGLLCKNRHRALPKIRDNPGTENQGPATAAGTRRCSKETSDFNEIPGMSSENNGNSARWESCKIGPVCTSEKIKLKFSVKTIPGSITCLSWTNKMFRSRSFSTFYHKKCFQRKSLQGKNTIEFPTLKRSEPSSFLPFLTKCQEDKKWTCGLRTQGYLIVDLLSAHVRSPSAPCKRLKDNNWMRPRNVPITFANFNINQ